MKSVPYSGAKSMKAREETVGILQRFGAESVGFMDEFSTKTVILQFKWRNRNVQMRASAKGWASMYVKAHPNSDREKATKQGMIAVNCILRDWIKGQMTAIESGLLSFEEVFLPHMLTASGETVAQAVTSHGLLLPEGDAGRKV